MRGKSEDALTLMEMMVVVLVIGILAAIAVPAFIHQVKVGQDSTTKSLAMSTYMTADNAVAAAQREGKKRLVSFADMKVVPKTDDMHLGLVQDFDAAGARRFCVLAYSDKSDTYTKDTPLAVYKGETGAACPVDTSIAIWR